jgi:hypothetical protein
MTKTYDGNEQTTYTLNSGRVIVLSNDEFDEIVVGSEKMIELHENIMELECEVASKYKKIVNLEDDNSHIDSLKAQLYEYEEDEIVQLILKLRKIGNTDAGDFLGHIERTAKAILKGVK